MDECACSKKTGSLHARLAKRFGKHTMVVCQACGHEVCSDKLGMCRCGNACRPIPLR